jgi:hypothetical protein
VSNTVSELPDLSDEQLATDPRVGMLKIAFEFLMQQGYFSAAAMMVAEHIRHIQRIEAAESSGNLSMPSVRTAATIWRREIHGFKYWFGAADNTTVARLMQELTAKGIETFVADLAVELQVSCA